ncbi:DUF6966 domain-containing protein [Thalassolituus sp. LLYu03]|uniref:DUF6966 domain-containing protein n=1 Tax=Thalassolituus sp. LLYu03 TaxID=3421656 RepID=UPI003D2DCACF
MGLKTEELIIEFEECADMLRSCSENHWAQWLEKSASYLKQGHFTGIELFEGAFGGMGSINDLVLTPMNGHSIDESEVDFYNRKLNVHLNKAHELIKEIRKNAVFK